MLYICYIIVTSVVAVCPGHGCSGHGSSKEGEEGLQSLPVTWDRDRKGIRNSDSQEAMLARTNEGRYTLFVYVKVHILLGDVAVCTRPERASFAELNKTIQDIRSGQE